MQHITSDLWWKNAIIYCLDIETFNDSNGDGCGDVRGLTEKLDYLAGIGVTCIWLMPFYASPMRDDGYDISDFYGVRDAVGDFGDFTQFTRAASERGMRVIADLVVNHTSDQHPWFQESRSNPDSPYRDFYVWADEPPEDADEGVVFPGQVESRWSFDEERGAYYLHSFYEHQPDLNITNPSVREEIMKLLGFWVQQGLSGFRVDAVPFLIETDDIPTEANPQPHDLLADIRDYLGRRSGNAILLGEVNLPPDEQAKFFNLEGSGEQLHMVFSFPVNQRMYLALAREDPAPLIEALNEIPPVPSEGAWANFVRNHDELSLDKLSEDERNEVFDVFGPHEEMQVFGRGLRRRLPPMLDGDERRIRMVYSLMFSLPGAPVLFYGEEIGMGENLDIEGRMSVRTPMQWAPGPNGGFSTADPSDFFRPISSDPDYGPDAVNVEHQRRDPDSLLNWMEKLIRERRECPEIAWGDWHLIDSVEAPALALRHEWDDRRMITVHNLSSEPCKVSVEVSEEGELHDLMSDRTYDAPADGTFEIDLEPYDHRWIRIREG